MENTAIVENPYGLSALWAQGDWVSKGTLLVLALMSLGSWYIMLTKLWDQEAAPIREGCRKAVLDRPVDQGWRRAAQEGRRLPQHRGRRLARHHAP